MEDQTTRTRRNAKRVSSSAPLYLECISSEDDGPFHSSANRSYKKIISTPIQSRLSRNRPKQSKMENEAGSSSNLGRETLGTPARQSARHSVKTVLFQHSFNEIPKAETINSDGVTGRRMEDPGGTTSCVGVSTPKKSAQTTGATNTPRKSSHLLNQIKDTKDYCDKLLGSSKPLSGKRTKTPNRQSLRDRQPNKKYTSEPIGETSLRIKMTPLSTMARSTARASRSRTPKKSKTPACRSRGQSSTRSSSKGPEAYRKSQAPKSSTAQAKSPSNTTPRGRGRPSSSINVKSPITPKTRGRPRKDVTVDEDNDNKDSSDERTTVSGSSDSDGTEEGSDSDEDDQDSDSHHAPLGLRRNLSQRFEDLDFENAWTPEILKQLRTKAMDNITPRRLLQASSQGNEQDSPNPETYFLATNRLKFLPEKKAHLPNDSRKGKGGAAKKPRKGTRGTGGQKIINLPERPKSIFSVTKEANRVAASKLVVPLAGNKHSKEIDSLLRNQIIPDFPRWIYYMREGFNIMLHGYGSKIPVFQAFKAHLDGEWLVITVNGLYPKLNPRKFLLDLRESLELEEKIRVVGANMDVVAEEVYAQLKDVKHPRVFLLVRNFDSLTIRHPAFLAVLSSIARVKWIHILASSDNVNAFLGVNQNQSLQLNFCWIPCSTFQPYEEELTWVPGVFGEETNAAGAKNTLQYVLKSLTGNARKAFSILASLQLGKMEESKGKRSKEFTGVEFRDLARRCRERFIAHSDAALKTLLIEFVDHKLLNHSGKNKNVGNLLTIDLDKETLEELASAGM